MFIIGDVHGCLKTLEALIDKLPNQKDLVFVGDLIDRGPSSPEVLDFVRAHPEWRVVRGNHEDMMLSFFEAPVPTCPYPGSVWGHNGGEPRRYTKEQIDWVASWPLYLEFPDLKDEAGRHLFVSHAAPYYDTLDECCDLTVWHRVDFNILWNRMPPYPSKDRFFVYGHNSETTATVEDHYAMIDTACVYHGRRWTRGPTHLTALEFPSKKLFSQVYLG